jgi:hypothetical protein
LDHSLGLAQNSRVLNPIFYEVDLVISDIGDAGNTIIRLRRRIAMKNRIFSLSAALLAANLSFTSLGIAVNAVAADALVTDPTTGIVYRQEVRAIETPVVDTQIKKEERVLYRPQTITDVKNEARTTYTPVVEYKWEPRLHGRWNPFTQPTIAYHHVPVTRWEAKSEVIPRTTTRTEWVAEKQVIEVPTRTVRIERTNKTDYVAVGKVAPASLAQQPTVSDQIASRMRPLDSNMSVQPFMGTPQSPFGGVSQIANDQSSRDFGQSGMRAIELYRNASSNQLLPPSSGAGVAGFPIRPFWR